MKRIVVLLTTCLLIMGSIMGIAATQVSPQVTVDYPDLDYSMGANKYGTVYMGDVLEKLLGKELSAFEKDVIRNDFPGQNALYYKRPSIIKPQVSYDGDLEELTVVISEDYIYDADYDCEIHWRPSGITADGKYAKFEPAADLGKEFYRAVVRGVAWSANILITIEYSADFTISADTLNDFVNFAYDTAAALNDEYAVYQTSLEQYQIELDAYNENQVEWVDYQTELDAYKDYLDKVALYQDYLLYLDYLEIKKEYDAEYAKYSENQAAWAAYNAQKAQYESYLAYAAQYPALMQKYQAEYAVVRGHLDLLALMEVTDPVSVMSFFDVVLDDRVGDVIANKKDQISALEESAVDSILESTPVLQNFCATYRSLGTDQERYAYYTKEYSMFIRHLRQMHNGVNKLYRNGIIYATLEKDYPEYISSLKSMLGLLYAYNCVFNDSITLDLNYEVDVHGHQTAGQLVDASLLPATDNNQATPAASWPAQPASPETFAVKTAPVAPAVKLEEPKNLALPDFSVVTSPDEFSENMKEPEKMDEPVKPELEVPHPGTPPALSWDDTHEALHEAYLQGEIAKRDPFGAAQTVTLHASASHSASFGDGESYYLVHFYNSDQAGTYLGCDAVRYGEAGAYPDYLPVPTIKPVGPDAYEFDIWVTEDGEPADLSVITEDVEVYATYKAVPRKCTVTWNVGGTLIKELYPYGATPAYNGSTDRAPSAEYIFTFSGWDREITTLLDDVTYTAQYTTVPNRHKVSFVMGDGSVIEKEYVYGKDLTDAVPLQKPYKAPDAQYTYTFAGWDDGLGNRYTDAKDFPMLTCPVTYTAAFDAHLNKYTVTWIVDGVALSETYEYGSMPVYKGSEDEVPAVPSTKQYDYVFVSWDHPVAVVTQDVTYTAQFDSVTRKYTINFLMGDRIVSGQFEYGAMPQFEGALQRESDVQYEYTFVEWNRAFVAVTEDADYEALYKKQLRKYPVVFVVEGESVTAECEYGTVPTYPSGTPKKASDTVHYYKFIGWDQTPVAVDGSQVTYTACFEAVLLAPVPNGGAGVLSESTGGEFELHISGADAVDLSAVMDHLGEAGAQSLQVYFGQAILEFPKAQIDAFYQMSGAITRVSMTKSTHGQYAAYSIELLDAQGAHIQFLMTELTVKLPYDGAYSADVYHVEDDGTLKKLDAKHENGYLVFSTMDFSTFVIMDKFSITGNAAENGTLNVSSEAYAGDTVILTPDPDEGYHVDFIKVEANGTEIELVQENGVYSFVMPEGNVQITAAFKVVEGGTTAEIIVGVITALLIVSVGIVIAVIVKRRKTVRM